VDTPCDNFFTDISVNLPVVAITMIRLDCLWKGSCRNGYHWTQFQVVVLIVIIKATVAHVLVLEGSDLFIILSHVLLFEFGICDVVLLRVGVRQSKVKQ
jgi:hypothetical protein